MRHSLYALLFVITLLGGCGNGNPVSTNDTSKMELRVYQVPPENTKNLEQALNNSFATGDKTRIGSVSSPAPGQLLVLAPANLQDSIASSIKSLSGPAKSASPAAPPQQICLQFWSVDALAGAGADDAALAGLSGTLDEARKALGDVHFVLRDRISSVSGADQAVSKSWTSTSPDALDPQIKNLRYDIQPAHEGLMLHITYGDQTPVSHGTTNTGAVSYQSTGATTTVPLRLGQTLVLSQNPIAGATSDGKTVSLPTTRLYIVRADQVPTT